MQLYTVIYCIAAEGIQWQFFRCHADNSEHAEEQCANAYPSAEVLWVNEGESCTMD